MSNIDDPDEWSNPESSGLKREKIRHQNIKRING